jgi:hypothetical protein
MANNGNAAQIAANTATLTGVLQAVQGLAAHVAAMPAAAALAAPGAPAPPAHKKVLQYDLLTTKAQFRDEHDDGFYGNLHEFMDIINELFKKNTQGFTDLDIWRCIKDALNPLERARFNSGDVLDFANLTASQRSTLLQKDIVTLTAAELAAGQVQDEAFETLFVRTFRTNKLDNIVAKMFKSVKYENNQGPLVFFHKLSVALHHTRSSKSPTNNFTFNELYKIFIAAIPSTLKTEFTLQHIATYEASRGTKTELMTLAQELEKTWQLHINNRETDNPAFGNTNAVYGSNNNFNYQVQAFQANEIDQINQVTCKTMLNQLTFVTTHSDPDNANGHSTDSAEQIYTFEIVNNLVNYAHRNSTPNRRNQRVPDELCIRCGDSNHRAHSCSEIRGSPQAKQMLEANLKKFYSIRRFSPDRTKLLNKNNFQNTQQKYDPQNYKFRRVDRGKMGINGRFQRQVGPDNKPRRAFFRARGKNVSFIEDPENDLRDLNLLTDQVFMLDNDNETLLELDLPAAFLLMDELSDPTNFLQA